MDERVKAFMSIAQTLCRGYVRKNNDYGDSFKISLDKFGEIAFVTRVSDKMLRLEQLVTRNPEVSDEGFIDTVADMATYAIMYLMWHAARPEKGGDRNEDNMRHGRGAGKLHRPIVGIVQPETPDKP